MTGIAIDLDRIDRRLDAIWDIGRTDQGGVTRLAYSREETAAIDCLVDELDDRFSVTTDPIGNVFASTDPDAEASMFLGSHLDTVFNGGRLDGALGVVAGLEAIEAALAADETLPAPPVLCIFRAEESARFGQATVGSKGALGLLTVEDLSAVDRGNVPLWQAIEAALAVDEILPAPPVLCIFRAEESARFGQATVGSKGALGLLTVEDLSAVDRGNVPLWQAIQQAGFRPANLAKPTIDLDDAAGYLELHIEQGRVLEEIGDAVGVVTSIRAPVRYQVTVVGSADHSGATPMGMRRDALACAAKLVSAVESIATDAADDGDVVATVGDVSAPDGAINKVCGEVTFPLDIRSNDVEFRDSVEESILGAFEDIVDERDLELELELLGRSDPVDLDPSMIERLEDIATETGTRHRRLPSGGGHDAMNFQTVDVPTGLLFVPSVDGVSHSPREATSRAAVRDATAMLARALLRGPV